MNIYVGNLSFDTTEEGMKQLFGQFGAVDSASIIMDRVSGKSRGFGFVTMPNDQEAEKAIAELNNADFQGRNLKVNQAREKTERAGSGGAQRRPDRY